MTVAIIARHRPLGFPLALGFAAIAAGFATTTVTTLHVAHPVLVQPSWSASVTGFVEAREERARSYGIAVRVRSIEARRTMAQTDRVRVAVRKGTAPVVGFVAFEAHLSPPVTTSRAACIFNALARRALC